MKAIEKTVSAILFSAAVHLNPAAAETYRVYNTSRDGRTPVEQLVYAVTNATASGDIVLIEPGTYTFTGNEYSEVDSDGVTNLLRFAANNVSIIGDISTSRRDWTAGAEPVIIDVNGKGRLFCNKDEYYCKVKNITVAGCNLPGSKYGSVAYVSHEMTFTNCVFRNTTGGAYSLWGASNLIKIYDCMYTNNSSYCRGEAYGCDFVENTRAFYWLNSRDCRFENNTSSDYIMYACNTVSNCVFRSNTATHCLISYLNSDAVLTDCLFVDNSSPYVIRASANKEVTNEILVAGCAFTNNIGSALSLYRESAGDYFRGVATVSNCVFYGNTARGDQLGKFDAYPNVLVQGSTGDVSRCVVYGSEFRNNGYEETLLGGCVLHSVTARNCSFSADPDSLPGFSPQWYYYNEAARSSILEDCDISAGELCESVLNRCDIHDVTTNTYCLFKGYTRVTNSIVRNCANYGLYLNLKKLDAEFVNCTIVSNRMATMRFLWDNVTNKCNFVNCLFNGNRYSTANSDITLWDNSARSLYFWQNAVNFTNTFYGAFAAHNKLNKTVFAEKTDIENALVQCADPKFAGSSGSVRERYPDEPFFALSYNSPLLGAGFDIGWPEGATDLAGRPRVRDGMTDVGCYQCFLARPAFKIVIQ